MIKSIIYAPIIDGQECDTSEVVYINATSTFISEKYCILRSDIVIFLGNNTDKIRIHSEFCDYFDIPYINIHTKEPIILSDQRRIALVGDTNKKEDLNSTYLAIKKIADKQDITIYSSRVKSSGTKIAEILIKKEKKND